MPADFVIRTGDTVKITIPKPAIIPAIEAPVPLIGSSTNVTAVGPLICLFGDELPKVIAGPLPYTAPPFVTPGVGKLTLTLTPTNFTALTVNGKPILIKGTPFVAVFNVTAPAIKPTPDGPVPDPLVVKTGTAQFITTNATVRAG